MLSLVTYSIGASIAKAVAKLWLKDKGILPDVIPDLIDLVKGTAEGARDAQQAAQRIENLGVQVVQQIQPVFNDARLNADSRAAVARELATTLAAARLRPATLVECKLNPVLLAEHLKNLRPDADKLLSDAETALYQRLLQEFARAIVEIAGDLQGFDSAYYAASLRDTDKLLTMLAELRQQPERRDQEFEQKYHSIVKEQLDKLELFGLPNWDRFARAQRLTGVYVTLKFELQKSDHSTSKGSLIGQPDETVFQGMSDSSAQGEIVQKGDIDQLLAVSRRIVIRGEAGSGKSTLLQWLAVRSAGRSFTGVLENLKNTVPFYIRLRERVDNGLPAPEEFPQLIAKSIVGTMPAGWVHRQLESGRALVLVDGIDELPQAQRDDLLQALSELITAYPFARYIISSRPPALKNNDWPAWSEWTHAERFIDATLQPMAPDQTNLLIRQWHTALEYTITDTDEISIIRQLPQSLIRLLARRPMVRRLTVNPLLCSMICALHYESRENLPSDRLKLYQSCVDLLLSKRDQGRRIPIGSEYAQLTAGQQLVLVQNFAYWMARNNYSDVTIEKADELIASRLPTIGNPSSIGGASVRRYLVERTGLLREPVVGRIDFAHRTFQDFLAAKQAVKENDFGVLIGQATNDQWRELIVLAAGEARPYETADFLQKLVSAAQEQNDTALRERILLLAVACLETCIELDPAVRAFVIDQAKSLFPPKDNDEARQVAAAGDPAVPLLRYNSAYTAREAIASIRALAQIGTDTAMHAIAGYVTSPKPEVHEAIVESWELFDRAEYARYVLSKSHTLRVFSLTTLEGFEHLSSLASLITYQLAPQTDLAPLVRLSSIESISVGSWDDSLRGGPWAGPDFVGAALNWGDPHRLRIGPPKWQVTDAFIKEISKINSLKEIFLFSSGITDLTPLTNLSQLASLQLAHGAYTSLAPIAGLTNLKQFHHFGDHINDITPLSALTNLSLLFLQDHNMSDIASLAALTGLDQLLLQSNKITDLSALLNLTGLTGLWLASATLTDISPIAHLTHLTQLQLVSKTLTDLTPLTALSGLKTVQLACRAVTDLTPLANLTNLTALYLQLDPESKVSLSPLAALTQLERIDLNGVLTSEKKALQDALPNAQFV